MAMLSTLLGVTHSVKLDGHSFSADVLRLENLSAACILPVSSVSLYFCFYKDRTDRNTLQ